MDGDVPRRASYGVYISQLIRFARVCNHVTDFNARNKCLTAKLLQQGYRYHKLRKTFSKFYRRHYELISKYNVGLKTLLSEGLSEPGFYGDVVYKFKKLIGSLIETSCLLLGPPGSNWCFSFAPELVSYSAPRDLHRRAAY